MKLKTEIGGQTHHFDSLRSHSIAIPINFFGPQVNHFGAAKAQANPMRSGSFIGDVRLGGSCNAFEFQLNPHCHGTHTESISHVTSERVPPYLCINENLMPCGLVTVQPISGANSPDSYRPAMNPQDRVIDKTLLSEACRDIDTPFLKALVVRTLPNTADKLAAHYNSANEPPFFSSEAMTWIREQGVEHLLVDFPSVDRLNDDGLLHNHRNFWQLEAEGHDLIESARKNATITELVYCPSEIKDGMYLLNLTVPALTIDAVPSNPILYPLELSS